MDNCIVQSSHSFNLAHSQVAVILLDNYLSLYDVVDLRLVRYDQHPRELLLEGVQHLEDRPSMLVVQAAQNLVQHYYFWLVGTPRKGKQAKADADRKLDQDLLPTAQHSESVGSPAPQGNVNLQLVVNHHFNPHIAVCQYVYELLDVNIQQGQVSGNYPRLDAIQPVDVFQHDQPFQFLLCQVLLFLEGDQFNVGFLYCFNFLAQRAD